MEEKSYAGSNFREGPPLIKITQPIPKRSPKFFLSNSYTPISKIVEISILPSTLFTAYLASEQVPILTNKFFEFEIDRPRL